MVLPLFDDARILLPEDTHQLLRFGNVHLGEYREPIGTETKLETKTHGLRFIPKVGINSFQRLGIGVPKHRTSVRFVDIDTVGELLQNDVVLPEHHGDPSFDLREIEDDQFLPGRSFDA